MTGTWYVLRDDIANDFWPRLIVTIYDYYVGIIIPSWRLQCRCGRRTCTVHRLRSLSLNQYGTAVAKSTKIYTLAYPGNTWKHGAQCTTVPIHESNDKYICKNRQTLRAESNTIQLAECNCDTIAINKIPVNNKQRSTSHLASGFPPHSLLWRPGPLSIDLGHFSSTCLVSASVSVSESEH